ncbi:MAG: PEP-CTERM sorting domain-containing protein, partial [Tepidisphaeraceae bacterium]
GSPHAGYWLFPTQSDTPPSNILIATGTNNANFFDPILGETDPASGLTNVGAFADSPGPYGTFDQGGNVYQWTETVINGSQYAFLGGAFDQYYTTLEAGNMIGSGGSANGAGLGFRIAEVPEPSSLALLAVGAFALLRRRRTHRP